MLAVLGAGGSKEFGSDWAVILRANRQLSGSDVAVLWQGMDLSEGRKTHHAIDLFRYMSRQLPWSITQERK